MKTYSDSVLMHQTKKQLIDYIRLLEENHCEDEAQIDRQAKNYAKLLENIRKETAKEIFQEMYHLVNNADCVVTVTVEDIKVIATRYGVKVEE